MGFFGAWAGASEPLGVLVTALICHPSTLVFWGIQKMPGGGWIPWEGLRLNFFLFIKGDMAHELVRHFLIETGPRGVKLKGCPNEPNFGKLSQPPRSPLLSSYPKLLSPGCVAPLSEAVGPMKAVFLGLCWALYHAPLYIYPPLPCMVIIPIMA